jgi:uncharacterized protein YbaA (DUF1428 family)
VVWKKRLGLYRYHADSAIDMRSVSGGMKAVEAWGSDVPEGVACLRKPAKKREDQTVVFGQILWQSRSSATGDSKTMTTIA